MLKDAKILVIDDDRTIRETLAFALEQEGYIVDKAENGQEAIAKTNSNTYHLAIVDWRLPDFEGTKLLSQLKETTPNMVKIMLTGFPSMGNAIAAVNEHADAFLVKPVDLQILIEKIEELLKKRETESTFNEEKMVSFIETRAKEILSPKNKNQTP
jgi:DNA-binding response OmpR family regulator